MNAVDSVAACRLRMQPIAACLAWSLAAASATSLAADAPGATGMAFSRDFLSARGSLTLPTGATPSRPTATLLVTNCDDQVPAACAIR